MSNGKEAESPTPGSGRQLLTKVVGEAKGRARRLKNEWFPGRSVREYQRWMDQRVSVRRQIYTEPVEPGLFSLITPVWNGSPLRYLKELASSIAKQNADGACEWVLLDNGCSDNHLRKYFAQVERYPWVRLVRSAENLGILRGLRQCLEQASGRYVLPVDADDLLYEDALRVVSAWAKKADYPPMLYTDEDKIAGATRFDAYFKPDWDPVLLLNSAYSAHLGVVDRERALEVGAYTDKAAEGSADWDLFVRLLSAGYAAAHVPEVVYSWRAHVGSTADDAASKAYIQSSQRAVLNRYVRARDKGEGFTVEWSPLLPGGAHWRIKLRSAPDATVEKLTWANGGSAASLREAAERMAAQGGYIHLVSEGLQLDEPDWRSDVLGLFALYEDAVMVGGRIRDKSGRVVDAGQYFGFDGVCGSPNRGRFSTDPGYFAQMWKERSVSAVSPALAVVDALFLREVLKQIPPQVSVAGIGMWAGAHAIRTGRRVVYSPYFSCVVSTEWEAQIGPEDRELFARLNPDVIPDQRFYSRRLSLTVPFGLGDVKATD